MSEAVTSEVFREKLKEFAKLDAEMKRIKKEADKLKSDVKDYMGLNDLDEFEDGPVKATYQIQERKNMNEAKLIQKLKDLGLDNAIKKVEAVDQAVVEDLIYDGVLNPKYLDECIERKQVTVLKVKGGDKL